MCGIFGRFAFGGAPADVGALVALVEELHHRGPDGGAFWNEHPFFFGHRRLSILDLSDAGRQPMATEDGRYVITFNGEIYNYVELADELSARGHRFRTRSDTEVLLHGYAEWGERVVDKLVGMFAFAIADRVEGTLFLARDRFGEKPLFYWEGDGEVLFASELRAIAPYVGSRRAIDVDALAGYLCLNYVPGERTLLAGVRRVRAGTTRTYDRHGRVRERSYYTPEAADDPRISSLDLEGTLGELRTRLDDAVRVALRSDVPVALFLSGGLDSSLVAESAVRQGSLAAAFCLDVREASFSEWDNAAWVASRLGLRLERVPLGPDALDDFESIVAHGDDPLADSSAVAVNRLAKETGRSFKVVVSGDGGDELFGGYLTYKATAMHRLVTSRAPEKLRGLVGSVTRRARASERKVSTSYKLLRYLRAIDLPPNEAHFTWNGAWLPSDAARLMNDRAIAPTVLHALAERHALPERPGLGPLQRADAREYLVNDILVKVDRMTMAHSLESRAPLLDHRLAALALSATPRFEQTFLHSPKRLLRALADRVFGPRVSRAKKQGFSIPVHGWLRTHARARVEDLLSRRSIEALGVLDADEVERVRVRFLERNEPLGFEVWGLMVLVAWFRARVVSSAAPRGGVDLPELSFHPAGAR